MHTLDIADLTIDTILKIIFNIRMERQSCRRDILASSDFALVERCNCGAVHLTIGAVTLRLAPSAIAELAETLADAATALVIDRARLSPPTAEILS
ncbi:MAG TPA: hypothetical protein VGC41_04245 [Kofleriaceae bacterium]